MKILSGGVLAILSLVALPVLADTAVCTGKVTSIAMHTPGGLFVTLEGSNLIKVCDFETTQHSVTPTNCKQLAAWAAMSYSMEKPVTLYVDNAPTSACSSIPNWHVSNTRYFALQ